MTSDDRKLLYWICFVQGANLAANVIMIVLVFLWGGSL